jgi:hypothetical protein
MSKEPTFINHSINMEINENIVYSSLSTPFQQTNITSVLTDKPVFTITDQNAKNSEPTDNNPPKHYKLLNIFTITIGILFLLFLCYGAFEIPKLLKRTSSIRSGIIYSNS